MIRADRLGVKYSLHLTRKQTVRDTIVRRVRREGDPDFWALRDASFTIMQGESVGVLGPNGAGKSTLLQVLAGILVPSEGVVDVDGHVSSLLTLGVGFDEELSGTDNIRLAGAFMGLDHRLVEERLPAIIDYAEIGQFIDAPIKTYSAGMRARLGSRSRPRSSRTSCCSTRCSRRATRRSARSRRHACWSSCARRRRSCSSPTT